MSAFRSALSDAVQANRGALPWVTDVRVENGLLRIVLTLDRPVFDRRKQIDEWMFDCTVRALGSVDDAQGLPLYRGVDAASLERTLRNGIDVEPHDAHWYGDALEKALEYGGDYPSILIIDGNRVERPYRNIAADAAAAVHLEARDWAVGDPIASEDARWLKYSRLPLDDSRRGSPYETAYAWYIPANPREALLGVIECVPESRKGSS